ncbi:MAG: hypothetical protein Ta2A_11110 [Treponemataceae bacterium]|nr:MAG: hypothetical protein Ta2A_11110 [Treponemataceae bacterium]
MDNLSLIVALVGLLFNLAVVIMKLAKAPAKLIELVETIEPYVSGIVIAILMYFGVQAGLRIAELQGLIDLGNIAPVVEAVADTVDGVVAAPTL